MGLTLTNLIPDMVEAKKRISRELVGFIPASTINGGSERAAKGQVIRSVIVPVAAQADRTPTMSPSTPAFQSIGNDTFTIGNDKSIKIAWEGEDRRAMDMGAGYQTIYGQQIEQALRAHVNAIELLASQRLNLAASRAFGTAGATPFATAGDFTDATFAKKILLDNGGSEFGNSLVMNTSAGATLTGKQAAVNIAGTDSIQRQGILLPLSGLDLRQSAQVQNFTKGTGAAYTTNTAGYAVGATDIALITGTGTVLAGDVVTFAGDTNKYVVAAGITAPGTIALAAPGLLQAIPASAVAMTLVANSARNIVFNRSACEIVCRAPVMPNGNSDQAKDSRIITDERSGLSFDVRLYEGYGMAFIDVVCVYDVKVWDTTQVGILLG